MSARVDACVVCRDRRVAWSRPRVEFCYHCLPGGPFRPPPCRRCGAQRDYYSGGLCRRCHPYAAQLAQACPDCHAWGVTTRRFGGRCVGCYNWAGTHGLSRCLACRREIEVNRDGICRLCRLHTLTYGQGNDLAAVLHANRHGQQLFLADMHRDLRGMRHPPPRSLTERPGLSTTAAGSYRQLLLFKANRDLLATARIGFPPPSDPAQAAVLDQHLREHAAEHGWSRTTLKKARRGLSILLGLHEHPGTPIPASLIHQLPTIDMPARPLAEFLALHRLLDDDRTPAAHTWLETQLADLPEAMARELRTWADILWTGRTTAPRSRPRAQNTVQIKLRWALPTLHAWAAAGMTSLREISTADVTAALPASGNARYTTGTGLRSIFKVLKAHQVVFTDPTARLTLGAPEARTPLPADLGMIREGLDSPDTVRAAMTALLAFHALRAGQIRNLRLTDIRDGRLHLPDRDILLAEPVRTRLAAYLDHRSQRWPNTANPHLFIHHRSALGTAPVGGRWLGLTLGTAARVIRTDRIVDEVLATGGDIRRICDLFGLTVGGAARYTAVLEHPSLTEHV